MDQSVEIPQTKTSPKLFIIGVVVVILGLFSGYFLSKTSSKKTSNNNTTTAAMVDTAKVVGSNDTKTFSDVATGKLEKGGIKGEGTHHLTRPGGISQTVYLVSSIVDLDQFDGKQVEVNGQTLKGRQAGWLMDVGRIKILE
jgi:hypothetical protein